jgi:hypothetical protein
MIIVIHGSNIKQHKINGIDLIIHPQFLTNREVPERPSEIIRSK